MKNHLPDFVKKRFKVSLDDLPEVEHRVVQHLGERRHISRDINLEFEKKLTLGQRLADRVAAFGGSWTFIIIFAAILLSWVLLNTLILARYMVRTDQYAARAASIVDAVNEAASIRRRQSSCD